MKYVNLKKKNTNKIYTIAKRLASASAICFGLTAVIVLPMIREARTLQAQLQNQENIIYDHVNDNDIECVVIENAE